MTPAPAVIVTGAANGIGAATVAELGRRGARVLAVDRDSRGLELAARVAGDVVPVVADVTRAEAVQDFVAAALDRFGTLDGLFNNAGILGATAPITDYPEDVFDRVFAVNVRSAYLGMKYAIPPMRAAGRGAIVNTAFTGALWRPPSRARTSPPSMLSWD
jgi:NAD(P)-dependent dehydrogenase (short-subunit alcohol dehydrogenase family)